MKKAPRRGPVEHVEHARACDATFGFQPLAQRRELFGVLVMQLADKAGEPGELHVQVADGAQRADQGLPCRTLADHRLRQIRLEYPQRRFDPTSGDAQLVQLLGILAQPGGGLVRKPGRKMSPQVCPSDLAGTEGREIVTEPSSGADRLLETGDLQSHFVLAVNGGAERAFALQLIDQRLERCRRAGHRLDLDARQPRPGATIGAGDDRVVDRDLGGLLISVLEGGKTFPVRAHAEQGLERLRPGNRLYPRADRSAAGSERLEIRAWQRFVELAPAPQGVGRASEILQRRLCAPGNVA